MQWGDDCSPHYTQPVTSYGRAQERYSVDQMDQIVHVLKTIPRPLVLLLRNINATRAINKDMGSLAPKPIRPQNPHARRPQATQSTVL